MEVSDSRHDGSSDLVRRVLETRPYPHDVHFQRLLPARRSVPIPGEGDSLAREGRLHGARGVLVALDVAGFDAERAHARQIVEEPVGRVRGSPVPLDDGDVPVASRARRPPRSRAEQHHRLDRRLTAHHLLGTVAKAFEGRLHGWRSDALASMR